MISDQNIETSEQHSLECSYCGYSSNLKQLFQKRAIASNKQATDVCPGCVEKLDSKSYMYSRASLAAMLIFSSLFYALDKDSLIAWFVFNLFAYILVAGISLVLHELGHACAAKLQGGIVTKVIIGTGRPLFSFCLKETTWEVRSFWSIGLTYLAFPNDAESSKQRFPKKKYIISILAGPLVNLVLCLIAVTILTFAPSILSIAGLLNLAITFLVVNAVMLFYSLYPGRTKGPIGYDTDGLQLINFHKNRKSIIKLYQAQFYLIYLFDLNERGAFKKGLEKSTLAIQSIRNNENLLVLHGIFLIANKKYNEAISLFQSELDRLSKLPQKVERDFTIAIIHNNLSFALYEMGDTDSKKILNEAKIAFDAIPWHPSILQTYGCALVRNGKTREAIKILERSLTFEQSKLSRSQAYASLGIAYVESEKKYEANNFYEKSKKLGYESVELSKLEALLAT